MKTPDEIKRGAELCANGVDDGSCMKVCPYHGGEPGLYCFEALAKDCLAYIRELEAKVAELEKVKKERDAAIADMEEMQSCTCQMCAHYYQPDPNVRKWSCRVLGEYWADICDHDGGLLMCGSFEWRGVQDDDRRPD